jgi:hypothetical protein
MHVVRGQLPGPFTKLPMADARKLALDVVVTLASLSIGNGDDGLETAVTLAVADTEDQGYWDHLRGCGR